MMKKRVFLLVIVSFFAFQKGFCQQYSKPSGDEKTNPSYVQDMLQYYAAKSVAVVVPDSVLNFVKNHAAEGGYSEALALKCATTLRPIFNEQLSPAERIDFCNLWMKVTQAMYAIIPKYFYLNTIQRLEKL